MRVLQLHTRHRVGGGEDGVVEAEAGLLRGAGHDVKQVIAHNPRNAIKAAAAFAAAPWNAAATHRVRHEVDLFVPDVAHIHNNWFAMSPAVISALRKGGVPIVVTLHNYRLFCINGYLYRDGGPCEDCVGSSPWPGVQHRCYFGSRPLSAVAAGTRALHDRLDTYNDVDVFIALTDFQRDLVLRGGLPEDRVVVKANSVEDPGPRTNLPSASKVVLTVGRLSEEKGLAAMVAAWIAAAPDGLELVIVGAGPLQDELDALARGHSIRLAGHLDRGSVQQLLLRSRALLMPSLWYEGLPLAVLEAFAAGLPVLASDLGGLRETVGVLDERFLVDPTETAWTSALGLLGDGGALDVASLRARAAYDDSYRPERDLDALLTVYATAIDRRRDRGCGQ